MVSRKHCKLHLDGISLPTLHQNHPQGNTLMVIPLTPTADLCRGIRTHDHSVTGELPQQLRYRADSVSVGSYDCYYRKDGSDKIETTAVKSSKCFVLSNFGYIKRSEQF